MISLAVRELLPLLGMIPGEDARIRRKTMVQTTLKIDGMMCGMCESHINDAIRKDFSVKKVTASHSKGTCVVLSDDALDETRLRDTIDATGYTLLNVQSQPCPSEVMSPARKKERRCAPFLRSHRIPSGILRRNTV